MHRMGTKLLRVAKHRHVCFRVACTSHGARMVMCGRITVSAHVGFQLHTMRVTRKMHTAPVCKPSIIVLTLVFIQEG